MFFCYSPKYCRKVKDGLKKEAISSYGRITDAVSSAVLVEFSQFLRPLIIIQKSCFFFHSTYYPQVYNRFLVTNLIYMNISMNTKKNTRNLHIEINHISVILICLGSKDRMYTMQTIL